MEGLGPGQEGQSVSRGCPENAALFPLLQLQKQASGEARLWGKFRFCLIFERITLARVDLKFPILLYLPPECRHKLVQISNAVATEAPVMLEKSQGPGRSCEEAPGTGTRKAEQRPVCCGNLEQRQAGAGGQGLVGCRVVEALCVRGGGGVSAGVFTGAPWWRLQEPSPEGAACYPGLFHSVPALCPAPIWLWLVLCATEQAQRGRTPA